MTTIKWLPWAAALLIHAIVVCAIFFWSRTPQATSHSDFVAEDGLLQIDVAPPLPNPPGSLDIVGPSVCPIHNAKMAVVEVPIVYGLLSSIANPSATQRAAEAVREAKFPHAERWIWGGCCVSDERTAQVHICAECERAEKDWKLTQTRPQ